MEQERFLEACRWATSRENTRQGIGTLGEKTLHSAVKYYFQPDPEKREVPVGPFVADALVDGGVVEVQSGDVTLRFCGLDEVFVKEGETLAQGDSIGVAGEVPAEASAGAHLHIECLQGGQYIDPAQLFG